MKEFIKSVKGYFQYPTQDAIVSIEKRTQYDVVISLWTPGGKKSVMASNGEAVEIAHGIIDLLMEEE